MIPLKSFYDKPEAFCHIFLILSLAEMSLMNLKKDVKQSMKAAFAEGTTRNLEVQWKAYFLFCEFYGLKALPSTSDILCLYAQFLCRSFKSVKSVKNYISGVKTMHYILDIEFPPEKNGTFRSIIQGFS